MGYYNIIYQYGENSFLKKCKEVGVNGLIVVDLSWPENKDFQKNVKSIRSTLFNYYHRQLLKKD